LVFSHSLPDRVSVYPLSAIFRVAQNKNSAMNTQNTMLLHSFFHRKSKETICLVVLMLDFHLSEVWDSNLSGHNTIPSLHTMAHNHTELTKNFRCNSKAEDVCTQHFNFYLHYDYFINPTSTYNIILFHHLEGQLGSELKVSFVIEDMLKTVFGRNFPPQKHHEF